MSASLAELAVRFGCYLQGDPDKCVDRVATLQRAGPDAVSFLSNRRYLPYLRSTRAAAVILDAAHADACPGSALVSDNPYATYARIAAHLHPVAAVAPGVHPSAVIEPGAELSPSVSIGPLVHVGTGAVLGERVVIGSGCSIGRGATIGADTQLKPRVCIGDGAIIGKRVIVHEGAVVGGDGFGIARDVDGWVKVPQVGGVRLGDDVEVGANTTIDRGAIEDTVIGDDVRLDNLIQIAHNVEIGAHTAIAAGTAVAGSSRIGENCLIAGHVGIVGHIEITDGVTINAKALVTRSIKVPGVYSGKLPAQEARQWRRNAGRFRRLGRRVRSGRGDADESDPE